MIFETGTNPTSAVMRKPRALVIVSRLIHQQYERQKQYENTKKINRILHDSITVCKPGCDTAHSILGR